MIKDHLDNEFNTLKEMCEHWHINRRTFTNRKKRGYSLKECLIGKPHEVFDHLGNSFSSEKVMSEHYGIPITAYTGRKNKGWTLQQRLESPLKDWSVKDHLGNQYPSKSAMCKHYNINMNVFECRIEHGWDLKDALTTKPGSKTIIKDHLGVEFPSTTALAKHYGILPVTLESRLRSGWDIKEALLTPVNRKRPSNLWTDHHGNVYQTQEDLCKNYHISVSAFQYRIAQGWSLKETLETPQGNSIKDHLGNVYETKKEMCKHYGISVGAYNNRIKKGYTVKDALTEDYNKRFEVCDHLGNKYKNINEMSKAYKIKSSIVRRRLKAGLSPKEALTKKEYTDHLGNKYDSETEMCKAYGITLRLFASRKRAGWSLKDCLTLPNKKRYKDQEIMEAAFQVGMSYHGFRKRLDKGMSIDEALALGGNIFNQKVVDHLGRIYDNLDKMCKHYGISRELYKARERAGWSTEESLTRPVRHDTHKVHEDKLRLVGVWQNNESGLMVKITEWRSITDISVEFEDGSVIEKCDSRYLSTLQHPDLKTAKIYGYRGCFHGFKTRYLFTDKSAMNWIAAYECECQKCGLKDILTPQQMMEHYKEHESMV